MDGCVDQADEDVFFAELKMRILLLVLDDRDGGRPSCWREPVPPSSSVIVENPCPLLVEVGCCNIWEENCRRLIWRSRTPPLPPPPLASVFQHHPKVKAYWRTKRNHGTGVFIPHGYRAKFQSGSVNENKRLHMFEPRKL